MLYAPNIEVDLGIEVFSTSSNGIGGVIRRRYEDFMVKEIPLTISEPEEFEVGRRSTTYSVFWLEKRGLDTILAIKKIANSLKVSQKRFSFAGMKDRNALTLQRVSVLGIPPERLRQIDLNSIHIKDVSQSDTPVLLGSHWGNAFSIQVREIPLSLTEVENRVQRVSEEIRRIGGVSNYFGHQRFGLLRPITHIVGMSMLRGDFRDAAMVYLSRTSPYEPESAREARAELAATGDFELAVKRFPTRLSYELAMLNRLLRNPNDFTNAFRVLPRRLLQLFISAAQSWLFNKFLSNRLKRDERLDHCLIGELVATVGGDGLITGEPHEVNEANISEWNDQVKNGGASIVYPVPGFDLNMPKGAMYEIVKETMSKEGLIPRSFWISMLPEISSPGVFRPIALIPKDLKVTASCSGPKSASDARFEFSLIRGGYATVVLREFMKNDDPLAAGF
jgi:tRNA pseudouridine13 synthase